VLCVLCCVVLCGTGVGVCASAEQRSGDVKLGCEGLVPTGMAMGDVCEGRQERLSTGFAMRIWIEKRSLGYGKRCCERD
jgi:hypothetical protein